MSPYDTAAALVGQWRAANSRAQVAFDWPRQTWIRTFPQHEAALQAMPARLDRAAVRQACLTAGSSSAAAEKAFIAIMAWGFGTVGYGPFRTHRILTSTPQAASRLARVIETLDAADAVAAYARLASNGDCNLRHLGPAFGTKVLFFCQPDGRRPRALVLDSMLAAWLKREGAANFDPIPWSTSTYRDYIHLMDDWAASLACAPEDLEACIFQSMITERGNNSALL